jgi:hypothetical protein
MRAGPDSSFDGIAALLDSVLIEYAMKIKDEPVEHGFAFDRHGRCIQSLRGDTIRIRFGQRDLLELSDTIFMHNHPRNTSFSLSDIHAACMLNMLAMIAVTSATLFFIAPPGGDPYFTRRHYRDIVRCYIFRQRLLPLSKRLGVQDAIWDEVAEDMEMKYLKLPLSD